MNFKINLGTLHTYPVFRNLVYYNILNILQVVEKAFKHPQTEIRKATFQAWMTLMDNFAEDPTILCTPKRIKLITSPLVVSLTDHNQGDERHIQEILA